MNFRNASCIMHHFQVCWEMMEAANHSRFELLQVNRKGCTIQLLGFLVTIVRKLSCQMHCKEFSKHAFIVCLFYTPCTYQKDCIYDVKSPYASLGPHFIHLLLSDRGTETPGKLNLLTYIYSNWLYVRYVGHICVKRGYSAVGCNLFLYWNWNKHSIARFGLGW